MEYILAFGSTHKALKAEKTLKEAGVVFKLLTAPKPLSAYCDLVISIDNCPPVEVLEVLKRSGAGVKNTFKKVGDDYVKV